jgi:hypothetical protein
MKNRHVPKAIPLSEEKKGEYFASSFHACGKRLPQLQRGKGPLPLKKA